MNIGVFFGSRSPEHDVSIITGCLIVQGLKELGENVVPVYIDKKGDWYIGSELGEIEFHRNKDKESKLKQYAGYSLDLKASAGKLVFTKKSLLRNDEVTIDIAFPAFHGANGEDGTIQGLWELMNVPYVGCDVVSSAVTMDKVLTKLMYQRFSIPTTKFVHFITQDWLEKKDTVMNDIKETLTWPVIIKPARLGSSIGMNKAKTEDELVNAIEVALHYDTKVIVEECIEDLKDLTVAVMGNEEPQASLIQESAYSKDFFSYEDKYLKDGGAQLGKAQKSLIIPADLDESTTKEIQNMALDVYKILGCSGTARVDFLYDNTFKKYYANEVNPLPGTLYHHLWKKSGIEFKDLLSKLIELAKLKYKEKSRITSVFESEILQKAGSGKMKLKGI